MKFIAALAGVENQNLLKEEVRHFYPELKLSFSHKNFLTFKLESDNELKGILKKRPAFARLWKEAGKIENRPLEAFYHFDRESDILSSSQSDEGLLVEINPKTFMKIKHFTSEDALILKPQISLSPKAPSRAYYKLAEAFKVTKNYLGEGDFLLELGSSPGGATYFALQNKAKVIGVDPAEMESFLFEEFPLNFKHIKIPVQNVDPLDLPIKINYVAVDMNLNPHQSLRETLRIVSVLNNVKNIYFTLKIVKLEHIALLDQFKKKVEKAGFRVIFYQLPTHKKECLLFATKL